MLVKNITGKKIRAVRRQKKITQIQLAARLNTLGIDFDQTAISKIENQTKVLLDFEVKAVAQALGIPIEKLFDQII
ncbi:helix-turn-helix domain-containing protein [Clostridium sp. FP1]|uniref:helix-turn-helix domain-containing protein n=1 Tax=Clostridium sp. FP1 TaxID=2724076 RepID=UPI001CCE636B|nr:helix-turn-helix transcriptional regulator [Clostridium sp. FP1]MBZ9634610.1 helix-turn-helix domain-containing protein [Clostridium sp. FP1]